MSEFEFSSWQPAEKVAPLFGFNVTAFRAMLIRMNIDKRRVGKRVFVKPSEVNRAIENKKPASVQTTAGL